MNRIVFGIVSVLSVSGCASSGQLARHVRRGAWSGELVLHGPVVDAHLAAQDQMLAHCGGRFRIVEGAQAERVALADTSAGAHEVRVDRSHRSIHYVCVSRAPTQFRSEHEATATAAVTPSASGL
jgi:hypothetical protein